VRRLALCASVCLAALGLALAASPVASAAKFQVLPKLHDSRYCEIFLVTLPPGGGVHADVYNTVGLKSGCPASKWNAIDWRPSLINPNAIVSTSIAQAQGVALAIQNGPRRWWLDAIGGRVRSEPIELGGIKMRKVADLTLPALTFTPFTEVTIERDTRWVFNKGRRIAELTSPGGVRYAMQAYAADRPKAIGALDPRKESNGGVPEGWTYRTYRAKKRMVLTARGSAVIVRDGASTVYQRYTPPRWAK